LKLERGNFLEVFRLSSPCITTVAGVGRVPPRTPGGSQQAPHHAAFGQQHLGRRQREERRAGSPGWRGVAAAWGHGSSVRVDRP
jgi:hypothetical protein